jgi:Ran-binding protein 9/10
MGACVGGGGGGGAGWEPNSYGYHADDGHSFCQSGSGRQFGPTFTTGDVVGCGYNTIDNCIFYTKNEAFVGGCPLSLSPPLSLFVCVCVCVCV